MKKICLVLAALVLSSTVLAQNHLQLYGNGWNLSIDNGYSYVYPPYQVPVPLPPVIIYQQPPPVVYQKQYLVKVCGPVYSVVTAYGTTYQQNCWDEWRLVYQ